MILLYHPGNFLRAKQTMHLPNWRFSATTCVFEGDLVLVVEEKPPKQTCNMHKGWCYKFLSQKGVVFEVVIAGAVVVTDEEGKRFENWSLFEVVKVGQPKRK